MKYTTTVHSRVHVEHKYFFKHQLWVSPPLVPAFLLSECRWNSKFNIIFILQSVFFPPAQTASKAKTAIRLGEQPFVRSLYVLILWSQWLSEWAPGLLNRWGFGGWAIIVFVEALVEVFTTIFNLSLSHMLQDHLLSCQVINRMSEWLLTHSTYHEVLWETGPGPP